MPSGYDIGEGNTVHYSFDTGGIEEITGFASQGENTIILTQGGVSPTGLEAFDTTVNGQKAVAITTSSDPTHGVVLVGVRTACRPRMSSTTRTTVARSSHSIRGLRA